MGKRMRNYWSAVEALLAAPPEGTDWEAVKAEHLRQLQFFQHERLIHLIVTMTVAVLTLLAAGIAMGTQTLFFLVLTAALLVLLIPYIIHYFRLENGVQCMYVQYDRMQACSGGVTLLQKQESKI